MHRKDADRIANSVDPDQTAPRISTVYFNSVLSSTVITSLGEEVSGDSTGQLIICRPMFCGSLFLAALPLGAKKRAYM